MIKFSIHCCFFLLAVGIASASDTAPGVAYFKRTAAHVPMHVVQADIRRSDVNLAVVTAAEGVGALESWSSLIGRARPVTAITGTYFDTVSGVPVGSIGVAGHMVHESPLGTAFSFSRTAGAQIDFARPFRAYDFDGADMFLRAGPRLLTAGKTTLYPKQEGFKDPAIFARKKRTAMALTKEGKLLLVATSKPILLREWAAALKGIGAHDAMCLDGGSSTGLYYRGKSYIAPSRRLTNVLVVYESTERYTERLPFLN